MGERGTKKTGPKGPVSSVIIRSSLDQRFLLAAAAALFTASFVASLASPRACWPLPLISWTAPSPCILSEPTASPMPCLALPTASLVAPLTLSAVLPMEFSFSSGGVTGLSPGSNECSGFRLACDHGFLYGSQAKNFAGKQH